jgi:hypothetical protein
VADFVSKLKLSCEGLDPHKELSFFPTSIKELISLFGKRHQMSRRCTLPNPCFSMKLISS